MVRTNYSLKRTFFGQLPFGSDLYDGLTQIVQEENISLGRITALGATTSATVAFYSQAEKMFKNDPIGQEAKLRNARLSYYNGEFAWSQAQLNVLKSATTQLIANDALYLALLIGDNIIED